MRVGDEEDEDEGVPVCPPSCCSQGCHAIFQEKMPPLSVDILSSCPTQQQLSLRRYVLYCLPAHNGALSVLRQMLLVCLVNM